MRSVGAERNRGRDIPVILFAPCFVLADGAGTVLALFLWSVEPLRRVARLPVLSSRLLRIEASRWVTCGPPDRAPVVSAGMSLRGRLWRLRPLVQLGSCWGRTLWALPDDLHGGEAMSGSQIPASECPYGQELARIVNAPGTRGKQRFRVCAARVSRQLCANRGKASPDAGNRCPPGPFPSVRASSGFDEASGGVRTSCARGALRRRRTAPTAIAESRPVRG